MTTILSTLLLASLLSAGDAFTSPPTLPRLPFVTSTTSLLAGPNEATATSFLATELREAAMKLHTREQAPKEGQAEAPKKERKHATTHADYLHFLVDSRHVYQALEEVVDSDSSLEAFRNTGLERTKALDADIAWMSSEFDLTVPAVGTYGSEYAEYIRGVVSESIPGFMCHYYNYYFAHTAGGRMIGKQLGAALLEKRTLEFYKWDGDLNDIKSKVKGDIEAMASTWSRKEKDECVAETAAAFRGGGNINRYLSGDY